MQRLELNWIGKEIRPKLEPRVLLEDESLSHVSSTRISPRDCFDNRLIYGDNLLALKAIEQEFSRKVKCVYIDPPFNTQQAMEHYTDGVEHSIWLGLIRDRIEILKNLLSDDGTIFVHIDDNELGYLIVMMDEIFGRANRLYVISFKQGAPTGHKAINPGCVSTTNFLVMYSKNRQCWHPNKLYTARERDKRYGQFIENINESFEKWRVTTLVSAFALDAGLSEKDCRKLLKEEPDLIDAFVVKHARSVIRLARPDYKGVSEAARQLIDISKSDRGMVFRLARDGFSDMYFLGGERILFYADKLKEIDGELVAGEPLTTLWDDLHSNNLHKEGGVSFPKGKKPEALIKRVIELVTNPGDLVLDSFAGSGTTGAVAHKMNRRWIMIELGEQCHTHVIPRLKALIDGIDSSGITKAANWKGGGGFRYYRLAPSLLQKDKFENWVISKEFNPEMLAEACCKLEGFEYAPSDSVYWQHGRSTETDFIYVTTQHFTANQLQQLNDEVGTDRTLLVLCKSFNGKADRWPRLTVKKIPKAVLTRCEWGHDDYSLRIENLPQAPQKMAQQSLFDVLGDDE